jgi:rhamnosyltransferase
MKVLIILAAYNGVKYIKEQIDSIVSQVEVDIFIKIFDDNSTDGTYELIESIYSLNHERIEIIKNHKSSRSAANNFFQAMQLIDPNEIDNYDFIAFSDQDDIWMPFKLFEAGLKLINEDADLYVSNLILWNEKNNTKTIIKKSHPQKKYDYLFEGGSAGCTYVMTKKLFFLVKDNFNKVDYVNWRYFSHDWFVYFIARLNKLNVFIDKRSFILYRIHETNVHGQLNNTTLSAVIKRLKLIVNGWYFFQAKGFIKLLPSNSKEAQIYRWYMMNYFTRLFIVLKYNFSLIRSLKKTIQFFLLSSIPFFFNKNER